MFLKMFPKGESPEKFIRPVVDFKKGVHRKFEGLSKRIETVDAISLVELNCAKNSNGISAEQFDELVKRRVEYLKAKKVETEASGNLIALGKFSSLLEEFIPSS